MLARTPSPQSFHTIISKARALVVIPSICVIKAATNAILQVVPFTSIRFTLATGIAGLTGNSKKK
ncbi:hypothetical protein BFS15_03500 [Gardnerella sp. DNF01162]|nr:hypothetical protein CJ215_01485 [Gardnerella vaginalis]PNP91841.1 hypothetical protein BFS15_03500 [Gardnerella sp. DNF01162]